MFFIFLVLLVAALTQSGCVSSSGNLAGPMNLSFGTVAIGSSRNQSLTLTNSDTSAITVTQAVASGGGFTVKGPPLPLTLAGGQSVTFMTRFAPTAIGNASGSFLITKSQTITTTPQLAGGSGSVATSITTNQETIALTGAGVPLTPTITTQPASQTVSAGQTATFTVTSSGAAPLNYQWRKNGGDISGATSSAYTTPVTTSADAGSQFTVVVSNSAGNATSNAATLTVNSATVAPSITAQPASQAITVGQTATFSVTASGTAPLSYQWRKNGTSISGATSATYITPVATTSDSRSQFSVVVSNSAGSVTSNAATLTVNSATVAPSITAQSASQAITVGQTATFSVTASGTAPLSYQWRKNGTSISGATSTTYITPVATTSDSGSQFTVVVSNSAGNATSNAATLTVNSATVAPSITAQPASQAITVGQTAAFSVTASGTAPLSYQWKKNGAAISGATSSAYTTPVTTSADSGSQFTAVVSNSAGTVSSNTATLTANAAGQLTASTTNLSFGNVSVGSNSVLPVTLTNTGGSSISISNVTLSGAVFNTSGVSSGLILPAGSSATLNATFAPSTSGTLNGSVAVTSNASNSTVTISMSGTAVQPVSHSVTVDLTPNSSNVSGYNIYRSSISNGPYTKLNSQLLLSTTYTDSTVIAGQTYYYVGTSVDSSGNETGYSNQVSATIPTP
jgi:hypothetical protein